MERSRVEGDVVVVGAGTAGLACSISAADHGARVVTVEKTDRIGGTMLVAGGHLSAAGTRRQRAAGIQDSPEDHFDDVMDISDGKADRDVVRMAVKEAPRTVDWLDNLGFPFDLATPAIPEEHEPYSVPRTYWGVNGGHSILRTIRPLWDRHVTAGRIRPLLEHECTDLVVEDGTVRGVQADGPEGPVEVRADVTVLTTGGYGSNPDFFESVTPGDTRLVSNAKASSTGDGIEIARRHGASFSDADKQVPIIGGIETEPGSGRADYQERWAHVVNVEDRDTHEIYVNVDGERFVAEDDYGPAVNQRAVADQPGTRFWIVFDEAGLEAADQPVISGLDRNGIRDLADEGGIAWRADDPKTLATKAGFDPDGFRRTLEEFNDAVRAGEDPLGRTYLPAPLETPPYYAVVTHETTLVTFGGLDVNDDLQVLDTDGTPIPGLYAAGEALGAAATSGDDYASGMLLTPSLSFGRILGRRLAPPVTEE